MNHSEKTGRELIAQILIYASLITPLIVATGAAIFPFVFPKVIFFEIIVGLLAATMIPLIVQHEHYRVKNYYTSLVGVYAVALVLTGIFALNPERAFWSNFERMTGIVYILVCIAFSLLIASFFSATPHKIKYFLSYSVVISVIVSLAGLYQKIDPSFLMGQADRVGGTFGNPIYLGAFAAQFFLIAAYFAYTHRRQIGGRWYALAALINLLALYYSGTRSALLGLGVAAVVIGVAVSRHLWRGAYHKYIVGSWVLCGVAAILLFSVPLVKPGAYDRFPLLERATRLTLMGSASTRFIAWDIAIKGFKERPILGWGPENFYYVFNKLYNPESLKFGLYETWFDHAHNAVFDVLVTQGLVGITLYLAQYLIIFWMCFKTRGATTDDALLSVVFAAIFVLHFIHNIFVFDHPGSFVEFYAFAGIVVARYAATRRVGAPLAPVAQNAIPFYGAVVLTVLPVLLTVYITVPSLRQNYLDFSAQVAAQKDLVLAQKYFERAIAINGPHTGDVLLDSGRVAQKIPQRVQGKAFFEIPEYRIFFEFGVNNLKKLLSNVDPQSELGALMLGQLLTGAAELGSSSALHEADKAFQLAAQLSPRRQQVFFSWSRIKIMLNQHDAAIKMLTEAVNSEPSAPIGHWYLALALGDGNPKAAAAELDLLRELEYPIDAAPYRLPSAMIFARAGRFEDAAKLFELALQDPTTVPWDAAIAVEADEVFLKTSRVAASKKLHLTFPQFFKNKK